MCISFDKLELWLFHLLQFQMLKEMFGFYLDRFVFSVSMVTGFIGIVFGVIQVYNIP